MAQWTYGEQVCVVREILPDYEVRLFRIAKTDNLNDPDLVASFMSHYEVGRVARGARSRPAVLDMGVSMYLNRADAIGTARRWPVIGRFLAEVILASGAGFNIAETGHPGHRTVWGDPFKLRNALVDIVSI